MPDSYHWKGRIALDPNDPTRVIGELTDSLGIFTKRITGTVSADGCMELVMVDDPAPDGYWLPMVDDDNE